MKKAFVFLVAILLLIVTIGVTLAESEHNWKYRYTTQERVKQTIAYQHGCINLSNPHTHTRYKIYSVDHYGCTNRGCNATKNVHNFVGYTEETCPKH